MPPEFFQRQPIGAGQQPYVYTGPFNVRTGNQASDLLMQVAGPMMLQNLMSRNGMMQGQFLPSQNLFDQLSARTYFMEQQRSASFGAMRDRQFVEQFMAGGTRLMTGRDPTIQETARNRYVSQRFAEWMPMAINVLGPDTVDRMFGSSGSAAVFSQRVHAGLRTRADPLTGRIGFNDQTAGALSDDIYERLYGAGSSRAAIRGLRAGQAGLLLEELQVRGMLGPTGGAVPFAERIGAVSRRLGDNDIRAIAMRLPEIAEIQARGERPGEAQISQAMTRVRETHSRLLAPGAGQLSPQDVAGMAGGDSLLMAGEAERMAQKVKDMSGVVAAMREIFGDMGHPNAPMRELINGLEALTQGGLANMSSTDLERTVRVTHTLARQSGLGIEGALAMTGQISGMLDGLGVDRALAPGILTRNRAYFGALGDTRSFDRPAWGRGTREEAMLLDAKLRTNASASPVANLLGGLMRMRDEGVIAPGKETELAAMMQAVEAGQTTYDFGGQKGKSLLINRGQLDAMLQRDADTGSNVSMQFLLDNYGNQEYIKKYGADDIARRLQPLELQGMGGIAFGSAAGLLGGDAKSFARLRAAGVVGNRDDFNALTRRLGTAMSKQLFGMSDADRTDVGKTTALLGATRDAELRAAIREQLGPGATEAQVDAAVAEASKVFAALPATGLAQFTRNLNTNPQTSAFKHWRKATGLMDERVFKQAAERTAQGEAAVRLQTAFGGLGAADPLSRTMDAIAKGKADTPFERLVAEAMGAVDIDEFVSRHPSLNAVRDAMKDRQSLERDATGALTPASQAKDKESTKLIDAIMAGGTAASQELDRRKAAGTLTKAEEDALRAAATAGGGLDAASEADPQLKPWGGASRAAPTPEARSTRDRYMQDWLDGKTERLPTLDELDVSREPQAAADAASSRKTAMTIDGVLTIHEDGTGTLQAGGTADVGHTPVTFDANSARK